MHSVSDGGRMFTRQMLRKPGGAIYFQLCHVVIVLTSIVILISYTTLGWPQLDFLQSLSLCL